MLPILHSTNLPGLNPSLPFELRWSIVDGHCKLELADPMGTVFHTYEYDLGSI